MEDYKRRKSDLITASLQHNLEKDREERKLEEAQKRRDAVKEQLAELERLSKKPKGYPALTDEIAESTLGMMWLNLCATDGNVKILLKDQEVDDDTKHRMLITYLRLRLKGFTNDAVAKINPTRLMAQDAAQVDRAIREIPRVQDGRQENEDPDADNQAEITASNEDRVRHEMAQRLGLTAAQTLP